MKIITCSSSNKTTEWISEENIRTDLWLKMGAVWEHRSNLVMRASSLKTNVSSQQGWRNPRRALNAWEGDLARSPKRSNRRRRDSRRRVKRAASSFHFLTPTLPSFPAENSTVLHPGGLCGAKLEQKSLSLSVTLSLSRSCVFVWQSARASERRSGGRGKRYAQDARLARHSVSKSAPWRL